MNEESSTKAGKRMLDILTNSLTGERPTFFHEPAHPDDLERAITLAAERTFEEAPILGHPSRLAWRDPDARPLLALG